MTFLLSAAFPTSKASSKSRSPRSPKLYSRTLAVNANVSGPAGNNASGAENFDFENTLDDAGLSLSAHVPSNDSRSLRLWSFSVSSSEEEEFGVDPTVAADELDYQLIAADNVTSKLYYYSRFGLQPPSVSQEPRIANSSREQLWDLNDLSNTTFAQAYKYVRSHGYQQRFFSVTLIKRDQDPFSPFSVPATEVTWIFRVVQNGTITPTNPAIVLGDRTRRIKYFADLPPTTIALQPANTTSNQTWD